METITQTKKKTTPLDVLKQVAIATPKNIEQSFYQAQCSAYPGSGEAETFFKLLLCFISGSLSQVCATIISGKYLKLKETILRVTNNQADTLEFGFHNNKIVFCVNGETQVLDCTPAGNTQAYENVLEALYLADHCLFIDADLAIEALNIITPALESKAQVPMHKYEPGSDL
ncbi:hypothetical protein [Planktothrix rubescens]|uniref:hypothetical protein n=1 Tax=Planktothrix rubescens TaxID=59512 RepID=UPI000413F770|nr:hypothetical protein [Planktothrix rubescens]